MKKRFAFELIVGIIGLIAVAIFGEVGIAAFALFAAQPFIGKKKLDEREYQLFYKVGNITAGLFLIACVIVYFYSDASVNGHQIGKIWLLWIVPAFIGIHGAAGLFIFKSED